MRYYRYDLDQIVVVLDLTASARARALSFSILFAILPLLFSPSLSHSLSLLFRPFCLLSQAG